MVQQYKVDAVDALANRLKESKHLIFTEYKGLDVGKMTELRKKLYEADSELTVVKNRLAKLAYKKVNLNLNDEWFVGPVALVMCKNDDFVKTVNIIYNYAKSNDEFKIKIGYLEDKIYDVDQLQEISKLPSRQELIARLASVLNAPISKFVFVLKNVLTKPVLVLKAIEEKKQ